jgi:DNA-binding IclR family transcriptional regulator
LDSKDFGVPNVDRWPVRIRRPNERRSLSRSATRALDVLELFGQMRRPLRAIEIAKVLELHPSTANQLLKTMVESAHLTFNAGMKTYLPSPRLASFAAWMVESYGTDKNLRDLLRHAQGAIGEIVTLSTPNDIYMQILDRVGSVGLPATGDTERGMRISMFGTVIGAAYLSTLKRPDLTRLIERARIPPPDLSQISAELAEIRRRGLAEGPIMNGSVWCLAAALPPGGFPAPLVLGVAGPAERILPKSDQIRALLLDAAKRYGASVGAVAETAESAE